MPMAADGLLINRHVQTEKNIAFCKIKLLLKVNKTAQSSVVQNTLI